MGKKNKLKKFRDNLTYPNIYQNFEPKYPKLVKGEDIEVDLKGKWAAEHFNNHHPIILELACGRGEYTVALAKAYPHLNFIGVDVKGARIWKGATQALEQNLHNAAFLRTRIEQIHLFIGEEEADEIWITFPDPFLRESKDKKRLTSSRFLDLYKKIIKKNGILHLKTDSGVLYDYTIETLDQYEGATILYKNDNIYAAPLAYPELEFKTHYEREHLEVGKTIKYIRFTIN